MSDKRNLRSIILGMIVVMVIVALGYKPVRELYFRYRYGTPPGVCLMAQDGQAIAVGRRLPDELRAIVEQLAHREDKLPQNAKLMKRTGEMISEELGNAIDVQRTVERIISAEKGALVVPVRVDLQPDLTVSTLKTITHTLGSYRTYMYGNPNRAHNVQLATSICNYVLLMPGDIFSFNQVVGPRTLELGYRNAPVIEGGVLVPGAGGGVCQVSSTLYNAVLSAKLKVIERYRHSKPVRYVPEGRDATVAYDYLDLKFMNNRRTPIIIRGWADSSRVSFTIMGIKE